jgi:putative DNA primase/helicase
MKKPYHAFGVAGGTVKKSYRQTSFIPPSIDFQPRANVLASTELKYLPTSNLSLLESALMYARQGVPVFPLHGVRSGRCTCGTFCGEAAGKHPQIAGSFRAASTNLPQIRRWWKQWPDANIGLVTGAASGLVVLHVVGIEGFLTLQSLVARYGALPQTATMQTPLGSSFYFKVPKGFEPLACTLRDGIEFSADAGYAVAPPSRHASGIYEWC